MRRQVAYRNKFSLIHINLNFKVRSFKPHKDESIKFTCLLKKDCICSLYVIEVHHYWKHILLSESFFRQMDKHNIGHFCLLLGHLVHTSSFEFHYRKQYWPYFAQKSRNAKYLESSASKRRNCEDYTTILPKFSTRWVLKILV